MIKPLIIFLIFSLILGSNLAFAEQIFITLSHRTDEIVFDGKWSFEAEWKASSEDIINFKDGTKFSIRSAHDYENLYFLIDFISDRRIEKHGDRAVICLGDNTEKRSFATKADFCFLVAIGSKHPITLQGGSQLSQKAFLQKVENHPGLIAVGGTSDKNDRYSRIPHASYEFKIPIEIIGSSDVYSMYIQLFDANHNKIYNWPQNAIYERYPFIPPPKDWGTMISPDKSIPEFEFPLYLLSIIILAIVITRSSIFKTSSKIYQTK